MALPAIPLVTRLSLLGATVETTSGTEATTTAALANTPIYNAKMVAGDLFADGERAPQGNYLGVADSVLGQRRGKLTFEMELVYGGALMTLLKGCGYVTSSTTAAPSSDLALHKTLTFRLWENGRAKRLVGAAGNITIRGAAGRKLVAECDFDGIWLDPVADAMPAQAVLNSTLWTMKGVSAFTIGGATVPKCEAVTLSLGNAIALRPDATVDAGLAHAYVASRKPTFEADFEAHLIADADPWGLMTAGTTAALVLTTTAGSHSIAFAAPRMQRITIDDGQRDAVRLDAQTFQLSSSAGNDELTITIA